MLSKRLEALLEWIDADLLADIGCDHALLCIEAVKRGLAGRAIASDVAEKPLRRARENIEQEGLTQSVQVILADGLSHAKEADQAVIAGMGGRTIISILENDPFNGYLLLSPHKEAPVLRKYLAENGYLIVKERVIKDGFFYPIILAKKGKMDLDDLELRWGRNVVEDQDYLDYLDFEKERISGILQKIPESKSLEMRSELNQLLELISRQKVNNL